MVLLNIDCCLKEGISYPKTSCQKGRKKRGLTKKIEQSIFLNLHTVSQMHSLMGRIELRVSRAWRWSHEKLFPAWFASRCPHKTGHRCLAWSMDVPRAPSILPQSLEKTQICNGSQTSNVRETRRPNKRLTFGWGLRQTGGCDTAKQDHLPYRASCLGQREDLLPSDFYNQLNFQCWQLTQNI